jgi:hypothetical protein
MASGLARGASGANARVMPLTGSGELRVRGIERAQRGYGVLTRARLAELCGARRWREPLFDLALADAVARGSVVKLTDDLYEYAEVAAA